VRGASLLSLLIARAGRFPANPPIARAGRFPCFPPKTTKTTKTTKFLLFLKITNFYFIKLIFYYLT